MVINVSKYIALLGKISVLTINAKCDHDDVQKFIMMEGNEREDDNK